MRLALVLLCGCEALSGVVSLGTNRRFAPDAGMRDAEPVRDASAADAAEADAEPGGERPEPKSDLAIGFLSDPPQAIEPGGSFDVETTIANLGGADSIETTIRFSLGAVIGEPFIPAIAAGGAWSGRFRVQAPGAGPSVLEAYVDPQNVVPESDETNNERTSGRVLVSALVVLPQSLDLSTPLGCVRSEALSISNRGGRETMLALAIDGPAEFSVSPASGMLMPGETASATITFAPIDQSLDAAELSIAHDLGEPIAIPLTANGDDQPRTEMFVQFASRRVDLLFVIDDSCSMFDEQQLLGQRFAAFLDFAESETIDYHVAVTTTDPADGGRFVGTPRIITPLTEDAGAAFAANAMVGVSGGENEQGLLAAEMALSSPLIEMENGGFLRPEASLGIVYVSDEDDHSPGQVSDYEAFLSSLRPSPFLRVNAIVGDLPNGCGTASAGTRYRSLVDRIGGATASICASDWDQTLIALAAGGFGFRTRFPLAGVPVEETLSVNVDGASLGTEFWDYAGGAIAFEPAAVPEAGAVIEVSYTPGCR